MKLFISKLHYKKIDDLTFFEMFIVAFLRVFSIFYGIIINVRNFLYNIKIFKTYKSDVKTISIGNITTGGVGKTPIAAEIANYFCARGKKAAILSRGYGGRLDTKEPNVISDGFEVFYEADLAGDEPYWLAQNCSGSAVITCSNRMQAAKYAVKEIGSNLFILDDGFQHRKMGRDLNLLLVDNKNKFGNGFVLPAGPLRENLSNIKRADIIIVVNKGFNDDSCVCYCNELEKKYNKKVYSCKMVPDKVYNILDNTHLEKGGNILAFSAIGQPNEFYDFLKQDYNVAVTVDFEDHYFYDENGVKELLEIAQKEGINKLITTEKDAVKIKEILLNIKPDVYVYALKLKAYLDLEEMLSAL